MSKETPKKVEIKTDNFQTVPREGKSPYREEHSVLEITIKEFSNVNIHTPQGQSSRYIDYKISGYDLDRDFPIIVYPNGRDSSTEGYVSIEFYPGRSCCDVEPAAGDDAELTCVLSVVDVEGRDRFRQSYAFCGDSKDPEFMERIRKRGEPYFLIRNYISRSVILSDSEKLLLSQDDTLTLRMDVVLREYRPVQEKYTLANFEELLVSSLRIEEEDDACSNDAKTQRRYLRLDSPIAEYLRKESAFFNRMSETPMVECVSGWMKIPDELYDGFKDMLKIMLQRTYSTYLFFTFQGVLSVYAVADLYGVGCVLDTCRRWLKIICRTPDDAAAISRQADLLGDDRLKEIAEDFARRDEAIGTDEVWTFSTVEAMQGGDFSKSVTYFIFRRSSEKDASWDEDKCGIGNCYC